MKVHLHIKVNISDKNKTGIHLNFISINRQDKHPDIVDGNKFAHEPLGFNKESAFT